MVLRPSAEILFAVMQFEQCTVECVITQPVGMLFQKVRKKFRPTTPAISELKSYIVRTMNSNWSESRSSQPGRFLPTFGASSRSGVRLNIAANFNTQQ